MMLKTLSIKNFAVIESVSLRFEPGFSVFTGETGAGKSIVIEALSFLLGARGTTDWIRAGAGRLEVEGVFDSAYLPAELRRELDIKTPELRLRRELDEAGKGRAFFNGAPAAVSALARLGDALLDFHGQHEHQSLLKAAVQLELLDSFGRLEEPRARAASLYSRLNETRARLAAAQMSEEERLRALDLYRFQAAEIDAASPKEGEEETLDSELPRLKNEEKLRALGSEALGHLSDSEAAAASALSKAARLLEELARLDPALAGAQESLNAARTGIDEAGAELARYLDGLQADPARLEEVLSRQEALSRLKRKYGATLRDVLDFRARVGTQIEDLERSSERREDLEKALRAEEKEFDAAAAALHKARLECAKRLSTAVAGKLKTLGMPGARFSVSVEWEEGRRGPTGADAVEFLIAANPGEPLKPLKTVASGGEISRTMLGLKTVLAAQDRIPVLVFDEVDAGVGGAVAQAVGENLAALAKARQVLCVTHLPQVASYAAHHFAVSKETAKGRTRALVETLDEPRRRDEIARMLSGRATTRTSLRAAEELLASAQKS